MVGIIDSKTRAQGRFMRTQFCSRRRPLSESLLLLLPVPAIENTSSAPILVLVIVTAAMADAISSYRQVHVVTRHGAREHLQKTTAAGGAGVPPKERGGLLTVLGETQMEQLGRWLQTRYSNGGDNDSNDNPMRLMRVSSSATQRTIVSATALSRGFVNANYTAITSTNNNSTDRTDHVAVTIPVYSTKDVNDIDIRAYDKCPTFTQHLEGLYASDATWTALEGSVEGILRRLATVERYGQYAKNQNDMMIVPLENLWNVFDDIIVCQFSGQRSEEECLRRNSVDGDGGDADDGEPMLTSAEWDQLQGVAHAAELLKYHSDVAGDLIGRNLLMRMIGQLQSPHAPQGEGTIPQQQQQQSPSGLYVYSGHYPTLLGVLAALDIADNTGHDDDENVIPSFASALLIEEHVDGHYELHFKSGDSEDATLLRTWPSRDDFIGTVNGGTETNVDDWCRLCDNRSADVCLLIHHADGPSVNSTVAGFVLGCGVGALLVLAYLTFRTSCRGRGRGVVTPVRGGGGVRQPQPPRGQSSSGQGNLDFS